MAQFKTSTSTGNFHAKAVTKTSAARRREVKRIMRRASRNAFKNSFILDDEGLIIDGADPRTAKRKGRAAAEVWGAFEGRIGIFLW